jgi:peptidoglycan/LPS O-acetylase OafA/YrhL
METVQSRWVWALAPVALGFGAVSAWYGPWRYYAVLVPFSLVGILVAIKVAMRFDGSGSEPVQFVGRNSLVYYVTHFPVNVLVVQAGIALGAGPQVIIPAGLAISLAVATLAVRLSFTTPVRWLFEFPPATLLARRAVA